jgi:UDP-N-acetyl-D-galactosamine dehydrogenase
VVIYTEFFKMFEKDKTKIAIIGLGYVGLPLAVEFGKKYQTIGFDINHDRIEELKSGYDSTLEVSQSELVDTNLTFSCNQEDIKRANIYIVTVPTPINEHKQPDLTPLIKASKMLGTVINKGDIIIYESTFILGLQKMNVFLL